MKLKRILCLGIFVLLSTGDGEQVLDAIVPNVTKEIHMRNAERCILLRTGNQPSTNAVETSWQQIWIDLKGSFSKITEKILIEKSYCALSVYAGDDLKILSDILKVFRYVRNHFVIYFGSIKPTRAILMQIVRPLVWIRERNGWMQLDVFCSRVGLPELPIAKQAGIFLKDKKNLIMRESLGNMCANPFMNQEIFLQDTATQPKFLDPKIHGHVKELSGYNIALLKYFSQYYQFNWKVGFAGMGTFFHQNNTFGPGRFNGVMNGSVALSHAGHFPLFNPMFDLGSSFWLTQIVFFTRKLQPIISYNQIFTPFPINVWMSSLALLSIIAILLHISHMVYHEPHMTKYKFAKTELHPINFYLFPLTKITEPDPLPWFHKWSAGKLLYICWIIFCMMLVFFYASNLRAHLVTLVYEEAPDTLDHIIKRGTVPYMYGTPRNGKKFLENSNRTHTSMYKIVVQKEKLGGHANVGKKRPYSPQMAKNVVNKGDFLMMESHSIPYFERIYPILRSEEIFVVKEYMENYKWMTEHLSMRSILKPKQEQINLKPMALTSYYTSIIFYSAAVIIVSTVFVLERFKLMCKGI